MEYSIRTSTSTGKKKVKPVFSSRMTECVSYPRLVQTDTKKKEFERSKPVKIAELLGIEYSKSVQKEAVRTKMQPERLREKSVQRGKEKHEAVRSDEPTAIGRSVRRNLKFNEICGNLQNNNNENCNVPKKVTVLKSASKKYPQNSSRETLLVQSNAAEEKYLEKYNGKMNIKASQIDNCTEDINSQVCPNVIKQNGNIRKNNNENSVAKKVTALKSVSKKYPQNFSRESLLVQPNTVKENYMAKCNGRSKSSKKLKASGIDSSSKEHLNSQICPNTKKDTNKSKVVRNILPTIMVTATSTVFAKHIPHPCLPMERPKSSNEIGDNEFSEASDLTKVNHVKTASQQANNSIVQLATEDDTFPKTPIMNSMMLQEAEEKERITSKNPEAQLTVQSEYKDQNRVSTPSTMISVNREEIVSLECNLKHYICTMEENLSYLKSKLSYVTKLLSLEDKEKVRSNVGSDDIRDADNEPTITKKVMVDKEVQVEEIKDESVKPALPVSKTKSIEDLNVARSPPEAKENKENIEDLSARQICTYTDAGNHSFIELENQLDITHAQNVTTNIIRRTPITKKRETIGCERSLREYLLLKSNMTFLETPDAKKFKSRLNNANNADEHAAISKRLISSKILMDLQNLYSDSPES